MVSLNVSALNRFLSLPPTWLVREGNCSLAYSHYTVDAGTYTTQVDRLQHFLSPFQLPTAFSRFFSPPSLFFPLFTSPFISLTFPILLLSAPFAFHFPFLPLSPSQPFLSLLYPSLFSLAPSPESIASLFILTALSQFFCPVPFLHPQFSLTLYLICEFLLYLLSVSSSISAFLSCQCFPFLSGLLSNVSVP